MWTREKIKLLLLINKRIKKEKPGKEIVPSVMNQYFKQPARVQIDIQKKIEPLLHATAYGKQDEVIKTLEENPEFLTLRGAAKDPAGNLIPNTTAYQLAIEAGDHELAYTIGQYFSRIEDGEKERLKQFESCENSINNILTETPYNFEPLMQSFLSSSEEDIKQALALNFEHKSSLQTALESFRNDFSPREIKEGMHFNYMGLEKALESYNELFDTNSFYCLRNLQDQKKRYILFFLQVIGYYIRGLTACGRQAFGQRKYYYSSMVFDRMFFQPLTRTFNLNSKGLLNIDSFPITADDTNPKGLGYEYIIWEGTAIKEEPRYVKMISKEDRQKYLNDLTNRLKQLRDTPEPLPEKRKGCTIF